MNALPTVPPSETDFEPVYVYLPKIKNKIMDQTKNTNDKLMDFFKQMHIAPDVVEKIKVAKQKTIRKKGEEKGEEKGRTKEREDDILAKEATIIVPAEPEYVDRLPEFKSPFKFSGKLKMDAYYMNNRKVFVQLMEDMFEEYRLKLLENTDPISCDNIGKSARMDLMTHQKLIRDYMNLYTPYRGLLLIHGLGSGKTCSSIGIAEGFRNQRKIIVMTPAYLQNNYISEIKKCGDMLYRLKQQWEFVDIPSGSWDKKTSELNLAKILGLPDDYIKKTKGFWLMDIRKNGSNYDTLDDFDKIKLDEQLDIMIHNKYSFINYNGITVNRFNKLTKNSTKNIFDNSVVIIDEVHNFVSWIVNKINEVKNYATLKKPPMPISFYKMLMGAQNCRIVMLSGTPIMNYPNELAVLFNMLRGYIYTFTLTLDVPSSQKNINTKYFTELLTKGQLQREGNHDDVQKMVDYIQYNPVKKTLTVTRNPLGFENEFSKTGVQTYMGVKYEPTMDDQKSDITSDLVQFKQNLVALLNTVQFKTISITMEKNLALPDKLDDFKNKFLDLETREIKHLENFKYRIIGLVSYFRSADEALLPAFDKTKDIHIEHVDMSDLQFGIYAVARMEERKSEKGSQIKRHMNALYGDESKSSSSYRIYSRLFCNFVFPPDIVRPLPAKKGKKEEDKEDKEEELVEKEEQVAKVADKDAMMDEDMVGMTGNNTYNEKIKKVFAEISDKKEEYLRMPHLAEYSPKYARILKNIEENKGKHLVYSQFRSMEGIGLFALSLDANGFQQFRIKRSRGPDGTRWELDMDETQIGKKPMYALYTGAEDKEEREIVRHIFNGDRELTPKNIQEILDRTGLNNIYGDIIRVIMITQSGSEGINLMETRFVHIMEPFWHAVRSEQVIGRARRICSHKNLPLEDQTVEVFIYLMQFTRRQLADAPEINKHDVGVLPQNKLRPLTSDEKLYETGQIKEQINSKLLMGMKEASIDCSVYTKNNSKEGIQCFNFSGAKPDDFVYTPNYETDPDIVRQTRKINETTTTATATATGTRQTTMAAKTMAKVIEYGGNKYVYDPKGFVYEYETYSDIKTRNKVGKLNAETKRIEFDKA